MAEYVQHHVEQMLPELEKMQHLGLFTDGEIKCIIRKHRHYEYHLRRRVKGKEEYLQYIQYEINLLTLLKKRAERTGYFIHCRDVQYKLWHRIDSLFHMVCTKYKDDLKLWMSYIDFLKETYTGRQMVSKKFNKMIQVHATNPDVWRSAAKWELEEMNAADNARLILQRGIRFNGQCSDLWIEYFEMEMAFAEKLRLEQEEEKEKGVSGECGDKEMTEEQKESVISGKVALVVFREAVRSVTGNHKVQFYLSLLLVAKRFPELGTVWQQLWAYIEQHYGADELVWDYKARQELLSMRAATADGKLSKHEKWEAVRSAEGSCYEIYDNAVDTLKTEKMFSLYIEFCMERLGLKTGSGSLKATRSEQCISILSRADKEQVLSEEYYEAWWELVKSSCHNDTSALRGVIHSAMSRGVTTSAVLHHKLELELADCGEQCGDKHVMGVLTSVLDHAGDTAESAALWQLAVKWAQERKRDKLTMKIFTRAMLTCTPHLIPLKTDYLTWVYQRKGVGKFRTAYNTCKGRVPLNSQFFLTAIGLETNVNKKREMFEDAVQLLGATDVDLWLRYVAFETAGEAPHRVGHLHWRAMKTLKKKLAEEFSNRQILQAADAGTS